MDPETKRQFALEKARYKAASKLGAEKNAVKKEEDTAKTKQYFNEVEMTEILRDIQLMLRVSKETQGNKETIDYDKILTLCYAKVAEYVEKMPAPQKGDKGDKGEKGDKGDTPVIDLDALVRKVVSQLPKTTDKKLVIDQAQIIKLIDERINVSPKQHVRIGASVASIRALTDVNLDGVPQDEKGNYILGTGTASNITGLVTQGSNITITGTGTLADPYVINSTGGGGTFTVASSAEINTGTDNVKGVTPLGLQGSDYRKIAISETEPESPELYDLWLDESETLVDTTEVILMTNNHTQYLDGVTNSEIYRVTLATGQAFHLTTFEVAERGGGTLDTDFTMELYNVTGTASIATCSLNNIETINAATSAAIVISIRVTNNTGTDIDACYTVKGYITNTEEEPLPG